MTTDLTPAERAQWREEAEAYPGNCGARWHAPSILRLLDALDAAEAERDRLREQVAAMFDAIRAAHPVTESRRCGNRLSEPTNPPPGPPSPPIWCARPADGHDTDHCTTYDGRRLSGWAWGGLTIEVHPAVVTYRCETCRTEQDHGSPAPCATLAALAGPRPLLDQQDGGGER